MSEQATTNKYKLYELNKDLYPEDTFLFRNGDFYEIYQDDADRIIEMIEAPIMYGREDGKPFHYTFFPHYMLEQLKDLLHSAGIKFTVAN